MVSTDDSGAGQGSTAEEIAAWTRQDLGLDAGTTVTVRETACSEANCPPVETVVTVFPAGEDSFVIRVLKPVAEVDRLDVLAALAFGDQH